MLSNRLRTWSLSAVSPVVKAAIVLVGISLVLCGPLLLGHGIPMNGDLALPLNLHSFFLNIYPLWDQRASITNIDELDRLAVVFPSLYVATIMHLTMGQYIKAYLFACFLISSVSPLLLVATLTKRAWSRGAVSTLALIAAGFVYSCNPWALYDMSAPFFYLAYAVTPLFLYACFKFADNGKLVWAVAASLLYVAASGSPQYTVFTGVCALSVLLIPTKTSTFVRLGRGAIIFGCYLAESAYWIIPFLIDSHYAPFAPGYTLTWGDVVGLSQASHFIPTLTGYDQWVRWWSSPIESQPIVSGIWHVSTFMVPIVSLIATIYAAWKKSLRAVLVGVAIFCVSFFLSLGANGPLPGLYRWLVIDAPIISRFGWMLRSPDKFDLYIWLAYSVLCGVGFAIIPALRLNRFGVPAFLVVVFSMVPILQGTLYGKYIPISMPHSYRSFNAELRTKKSDDFHVLQVGDYLAPSKYPSHDVQFTWAPHRQGGFVTLRSYPRPSFGYYHYTNPFSFFYSQIIDLGKPAFVKLAEMANVHYIVVENDIKGGSQWYAQFVRKLAPLRLKNKNYGDFKVYVTPNPLPHIIAYRRYAAVAGDESLLLRAAEKWPKVLFDVPMVFLDQSSSVNRELVIRKAAKVIIERGATIQGAALSVAPASNFISLANYGTSSTAVNGWFFARLSNEFDDSRFTPMHRLAKRYGLSDRYPLDFGLGVITTTSVKPVCIRVPVGGVHYIRAWSPVVGTVMRYGAGARNLSSIRLNQGWEWYRLAGITRNVCIKNGTPGKPLSLNAVVSVPQRWLSEEERLIRGKAIFERQGLPGINKAFTDNHVSATWTWVNGAKADVALKGPASFIRLNETYDPFWEGISGDSTFRSIPGNFFSDGFVLSGSERDLILEYLPQYTLDRIIWYALGLAAIPVVILLIGALIDIRRRRMNG